MHHRIRFALLAFSLFAILSGLITGCQKLEPPPLQPAERQHQAQMRKDKSGD